MDIASFKVGHSVRSDKDATALQAARARSSSIGVCEKGGDGGVCEEGGDGVQPLGRWNVTRVGSIRRKTHVALPQHTANSEHTIGAHWIQTPLDTYTFASLLINPTGYPLYRMTRAHKLWLAGLRNYEKGC